MADYLNSSGLSSLWAKIKGIIPTKTSDLTNDSEFITNDDIIANITKTTSNAEITSGVNKVLKGDSYTTNIVPDIGYHISEVIVTMNGVDITESVFSGVGIDEVVDDYVKESRVVELINENKIVVTHDGNGTVTITGLSAITNAGTQEY